MGNDIQNFSFDGNQVRTVLINSKPYFVGKDITKVLGYKNFRDALTRYVPDKFKGGRETRHPLRKLKWI